MAYFVRDPTKCVTEANIGSVILFGTLRDGDPIHSLLRLMHGLYVPAVVSNTTWPETVRSDFTAQMHKFMATLTETVHEVQGKTILYIPTVGQGHTVGVGCEGRVGVLVGRRVCAPEGCESGGVGVWGGEVRETACGGGQRRGNQVR